MIQQLASLGGLGFRPEPLDIIVERRLKTNWAQAPYPDCGVTAIRTYDDLDRIWCRGCGFMSTYTLGRPFYDAELGPIEFLVAFFLYADSLLSINQIASLLNRAYNRFTWRFVTWKPHSSAASPSSGIVLITLLERQRRLIKFSRSARATRDAIRRGTVYPGAGRQKWVAHVGAVSREMN